MAGQPSAPCSPPSSSPSSSPSRRTSRLLASESERDRLVVTIARATSLQSKWGFELLLGTENYVSVHVMERRLDRASEHSVKLLGRLLTPEGERLTSGDVYWPDGERLASGRLVFAFPKGWIDRHLEQPSRELVVVASVHRQTAGSLFACSDLDPSSDAMVGRTADIKLCRSHFDGRFRAFALLESDDGAPSAARAVPPQIVLSMNLLRARRRLAAAPPPFATAIALDRGGYDDRLLPVEELLVARPVSADDDLDDLAAADDDDDDGPARAEPLVAAAAEASAPDARAVGGPCVPARPVLDGGAEPVAEPTPVET